MLLPLLLRSWGPETCDPIDLADWHPGNPSRGQCGVTAMVVREVLGGDLLLGRVTSGGTPTGHHYWNRLPDGTELDLTRDQFRPGELVGPGTVVVPPDGPPSRCRGQLAILRHRVMTGLGRLPAPDPAGPPLRLAMALLVDPAGAVLLRRRSPTTAFEPGQWSLPVAHIHDSGDGSVSAQRGLAEEAARRALAEEAGIEYTDRLHHHWRGILPDVTGRAPHVELTVLAGRHDLDDAGILADDLAATDLAPTAAIALQALIKSSRASPVRAEIGARRTAPA
ncbi:NUDIX domain-containing protein [Dactylosporangium vinaceum]|uniref:NUDIX domain-containing protein n=1 Tax=Dactylosporangium vinaceum TaxID=53362 RepID=A0ABV5M412_9ACTN|nr:NUDIX domain-containing protein [Dactylosporangium vinaceum]UAB93481.1 NUDIX domain-containing protein [Dactylosporangium vinaceum]